MPEVSDSSISSSLRMERRRICARSSGAEGFAIELNARRCGYSIRFLICSGLLFHFLDQASWPHVGPVLVDVVETVRPALGFEHDGPPLWNLLEARPKRVLPFIIDQHVIHALFVFERIGHHWLLFFSVCAAASFLPSSAASTAPTLSAGIGSIMLS